MTDLSRIINKSLLNTHLLLVEGVNGAGKSTFVRNFIKNASPNIHCITWRGCGVHPVDLLHVAILSDSEYRNMINECKRQFSTELYAEIIRRVDCLVCKENDYYLIPYLSIFDGLPLPHDMIDKLRHKEIYDGNSSLANFQHWLEKRWSSFPNQVIRTGLSDSIHIFEAVTLQYPVMEMLGYHLMDAAAISEFVNRLVNHMIDLNPVLLYIDVPDTSAAIINAARERVGWLENYEAWLSSTPYAMRQGLSGLDGVIAFCEKRRMIESFVVDNLPIKHLTLFREDLRNGQSSASNSA